MIYVIRYFFVATTNRWLLHSRFLMHSRTMLAAALENICLGWETPIEFYALKLAARRLIKENLQESFL